MAKYVDKEDLFNQGELMYDPEAEWEGDSPRYVVKMDTVQLMPPADVVERADIDKAFEDLEAFKEAVAETNDLYAQSCVQYCIEIVKHTIGGCR